MTAFPPTSTAKPFYNPSALDNYESPFRAKPRTEDQSYVKMVKNAQKALFEHKKEEKTPVRALAQTLVNRAASKPNSDNVSVIVAHVS